MEEEPIYRIELSDEVIAKLGEWTNGSSLFLYGNLERFDLLRQQGTAIGSRDPRLVNFAQEGNIFLVTLQMSDDSQFQFATPAWGIKLPENSH